MWRDFVSKADGTVLVDGEQLKVADGTSAYSAAFASFVEQAKAHGAPVLVRGSGDGGVTWFTVADDGVVAVAADPEEDPPAEREAAAAPPHRPHRAAPQPTTAAVPPRTVPARPVPAQRPTTASTLGPSTDVPESLPTRRKPSAADFGANVPEPVPGPASEGWRGVLNEASGHALRLRPGAAELQRRNWRSSVQRGLSGHKTVVVVNLKGGATKTTASYLAGATLGRVRGGNVLVWDNNENQGTLNDLAMPASHDLTATDLLANIERFNIPSNSPELLNYMRSQGENRFHVLASQNQASNEEVIDGSAFVQLHEMLRQFYHLIIVDTGNAATASTWQAAVEIADEIVLVALNKKDSSKKLAATVDTLIARGLGEKLERGVLILTEPARPEGKGSEQYRKSAANRAEVIEHFSNYVREIITVPYDKVLADGTQIVFENLDPATQRAYLAATAAIVDGL